MAVSKGYTIAEKILARASGGTSVRVGQDIAARPDFVLAYVFGGFSRFPRLIRDDFHVDRLDGPERFALFLDHNIPVTDMKLEARMADIRVWCALQGVTVHDGEGIGHVVASEAGYASPGAFVVHFDGHVSQLGTFGTLAMGIHIGLYEAFARPAVSLRVPASVRIDLIGALPPGVMARDVLHDVILRYGADVCNQAVLELGGPGLESLSLDAVQTLTGLAMFTGAVTAVAEPTARALAFVQPRAKLTLTPVFPDRGAVYRRRLICDLGAVRPSVAAPPSAANIQSLDAVLGVVVDVGYLGSCVSGRLEDLRMAARILAGRRVKPGFVLNVVPSSRRIMVEAAREGLIATLAEAGAFVCSPTCSYCYGAVGALTAGQTAVSTGTLNIPGRMGSADAKIYLANAAVVAAVALEGRFADPGRYL